MNHLLIISCLKDAQITMLICLLRRKNRLLMDRWIVIRYIPIPIVNRTNPRGADKLPATCGCRFLNLPCKPPKGNVWNHCADLAGSAQATFRYNVGMLLCPNEMPLLLNLTLKLLSDTMLGCCSVPMRCRYCSISRSSYFQTRCRNAAPFRYDAAMLLRFMLCYIQTRYCNYRIEHSLCPLAECWRTSTVLSEDTSVCLAVILPGDTCTPACLAVILLSLRSNSLLLLEILLLLLAWMAFIFTPNLLPLLCRYYSRLDTAALSA